MNFKRVFLIGAVIGALLTGFFAPAFFANHWFISFWSLSPWSAVLAWLCPFYVLAFLGITSNIAALIALAVIGDALLYGLLAMLFFLLYKAIRRIGGGRMKKQGTQNLT